MIILLLFAYEILYISFVYAILLVEQYNYVLFFSYRIYFSLIFINTEYHIKLELVDYNNECSTEQQQIVSNDNRKTQKVVLVPIKRKKDNVTESRLVAVEKKEKYQQLESSKFKITTFRSNKKEGSVLSTNVEVKVDTSLVQDILEKTVINTNKIDKGKKLQKQILQKEKIMKKKDTVCTYKDIGKHPHDLASCQMNNKECEVL